MSSLTLASRSDATACTVRDTLRQSQQGHQAAVFLAKIVRTLSFIALFCRSFCIVELRKSLKCPLLLLLQLLPSLLRLFFTP